MATDPRPVGISSETPLSREGGLPTQEELLRIQTTLAELDEFGIDRLLDRLANAYVDAFEGEDDSLPVDFDYVGRYSSTLRWIEMSAERVAGALQKLAVYRETSEMTAWEDGSVQESPPFGRTGGTYEISKEALERFGIGVTS